MRYVAAVSYYPNCRSCDRGSYSDLKFFNSIKDLLTWALNNKNEYEMEYVYSCKTGKELFDIGYELGRHSCTGVYFKHKGFHIKTQDDGRGNKIWVRQ